MVKDASGDKDNSTENLRKTRKTLRGKITRTINRVRDGFMAANGNGMTQFRMRCEVSNLELDFKGALDINAELIESVSDTEKENYEEWEEQLLRDFYEFKEEIRKFENGSSASVHDQGVEARASSAVQSASHGNEEVSASRDQCSPRRSEDRSDGVGVEEVPSRTHDTPPPSTLSSGPRNASSASAQPGAQVNVPVIRDSADMSSSSIGGGGGDVMLSSVHRDFDAWIDDLKEMKETVHGQVVENISIADALFRLQASKDIPAVELNKFNGNPLSYVDFIESFKVQIHDKRHLSDDQRMVQFRMHLTGDAIRSITGLGSSGLMYATALKMIKEQFGQRSVICRAFINKLTKGSKIAQSDRQGLREFSLDVINCLAIFQRISFQSDVNSTDSLRRVIMRLPDFLINRWRTTVTDIRERGENPTLHHISKFLRKCVKTDFDPDFGDLRTGLHDGHDTRTGPKDRNHGYPVQRGIHATQNQTATRQLSCYLCKEPHRVADCSSFKDSSVSERYKMVKDSRLCYSCLHKGHITKDCRSKKKCEVNGCTRQHHPLLHYDPPSASSTSSTLDKGGILPVVRVRFRADNGRIREGNVLIDSGAATTIVRKDFAKSLGLQGKRQHLELSVVGGESLNQPDSRRLKFWISSMSGGEEYQIEAHDIDRTVLSVPSLDRPWLKSFRHLRDIDFSHKAGPIDLILGVQYSHLHAEEEIRQGLNFEPVGKRTKLGWFVIGGDNTDVPRLSVNFVQNSDLSEFYEMETLGVRAPTCSCPVNAISKEDKEALEMMASSCHKDGDRYVVGLPWKGDPSALPDNYPLAEKRLQSLERSLAKDPERAELYKKAVNQFIENGWAVPVTEDELENEERSKFYLPHFGVYRPEKLSTPLRVVFDPACKYDGVSLNSLLHKGPNLIGDLYGVLLRFREERVAIVGDIRKMFLQVLLTEEDSHVHRFLWRDLDTSQPPTVYRLTRVTFGDKPSPDMACFVMLKLAEDFKSTLPDSAAILERDRYMDDIIHSCQPEKAVEKMKDIDEILKSGSFEVKEWYCSSAEVRESMKSESDETKVAIASQPVSIDNQEKVKTLGVGWSPHSDTISFQVKEPEIKTLTKRAVLSQLSMLYDPLGLATAVTIRARMAMQDIWRLDNLLWDDPLPTEYAEHWQELFRDLKRLENVQFPRSVKPKAATGCAELHVFADASCKAYGAVAYMRWNTEDGDPTVTLLTAKGRVAPLKQTTIPRLELMAALIASRLAKTIVTELKDKPETVTLWTDSQIVLHWLESESITLKPFVGVRVAEIQSTWDASHWKHVPTHQNPADDLSRGLKVDELEGRWINGPDFLKRPQEEWPEMSEIQTPDNDVERKKEKPICVTVKTQPLTDPEKFSSWQRLIRVTAYCLRFVHNLKCRIKKTADEMYTGTLEVQEVDLAKRYWIEHAQKELSDWKTRCKDLTPFIQDGILRVGGRLRKAPLTYDQKHPILLPASSHISKLIMRDVHCRKGHPGWEKTLCQSRQEVWILRGRNLSRKMVKACIICRICRQPFHQTLMADIPLDRLKLFSPPFTTTGVDLFGPFLLKNGRKKSTKAWGALFTCATVRAVHLEIVESLSTTSFLHAFRRFVAHHGWPSTVISDNGSSFIGTEKELRRLFKEGRKEIQDFAVLHDVNWKFISPLSPHQGGFYETMIKQVKKSLKKEVGSHKLTWNEMSTVFAEVQCLVNSRPLSYSSNDPNDLRPLTPNHFLIGRATNDVPQGPFTETKNLNRRFEFVQGLVTHVWNRFAKEYVPTLTKRQKWTQPGRQLKIDDVVLLSEMNIPRGQWKLGRITEIFPGDDGIVRNVKVKTSSGEYKRAVQKCCLILEADEN